MQRNECARDISAIRETQDCIPPICPALSLKFLTSLVGYSFKRQCLLVANRAVFPRCIIRLRLGLKPTSSWRRKWKLIDALERHPSSICEAGEMSLLAPVRKRALAHSQEPRRRQLDWLMVLKQCVHDVRSQIGQSNQRSEVAFIYSEAFGHRLDAVVRSRQRLVPGREIMVARPALTSASAPFSMTRRFPLPARRSFPSIDTTMGSRSVC
jgi:hypothetical protein